MTRTGDLVSRRAAVEEALWPVALEGKSRLWAVLDGARDSGIFRALDLLERDYCCLYAGKLDPRLARAAPYLVRLEKGDPFSDFLLDEGWGCNWGTFLRTRTSYAELRKNLRTFLRVKDESGRRMIFRWYDPRVLRVYLPTCSAGELRTVFGPVDCYLVEKAGGREIVEYSLGDQPFFHLAAREHPVIGFAGVPAKPKNSDELFG